MPSAGATWNDSSSLVDSTKPTRRSHAATSGPASSNTTESRSSGERCTRRSADE
jgi:hypothetical protein